MVDLNTSLQGRCSNLNPTAMDGTLSPTRNGMSAFKHIVISAIVFWIAKDCSVVAADAPRGVEAAPLEIRSLSVNGQPVPLPAKKRPWLGATPRKVLFGFGAVTNVARAPLRIRYKLDGFDDDWREVPGDSAPSSSTLSGPTTIPVASFSPA